MKPAVIKNASVSQPIYAVQIEVKGTVQGVGFRPMVYTLATRLNLVGEVFNHPSGVSITVQGCEKSLNKFVGDLRASAPPLAQIRDVIEKPYPVDLGLKAFKITQSRDSQVQRGPSLVAPTSARHLDAPIASDASICHACLAEVRDPSNRRFGYAFTSCTQCGPRYSITQSLPFDRHNTTMNEFDQCAECRSEYEDPADRRYHSQINACSACGPQCWLELQDGSLLKSNAIAAAAELIAQGKIVAIKGIGGFHLACDASSDAAVARLRALKCRPSKPFAVMFKSETALQEFVHVSHSEREALRSSAAPIVLLSKRSRSDLTDHCAPHLAHLGCMLPYSGLHALLLDQLDHPIVLTSANKKDAPLCIDNQDARQSLAYVVDAWLMHDRQVVNRVDDSLLREIQGEMRVLRIGRGLAPVQIDVPNSAPASQSVLACGGQLKNTFGLLQSGRFVLSQHVGELQEASTYASYEQNIAFMQRLLGLSTDHSAVDAHPDYRSTQYGQRTAFAQSSITVQHHHAHMAACMADNGLQLDTSKTLGLVLDGSGLSEEGELWGGELLLGNYSGFQRIASLKPVALPGGNQAMVQPWRNLFAQVAHQWDVHALAKRYPHVECVRLLKNKPISSLDAMMRKGVNVPLSSSCGRLFDAVAAAIGVCFDELSYEGEAAVQLESLVDVQRAKERRPYPFLIQGNFPPRGLTPVNAKVNAQCGPTTEAEILSRALSKPATINAAPMWQALLEDLIEGESKGVISARFHLGLARAFGLLVSRAAQFYRVDRVALSGGVFHNRIFTEALFEILETKGLTPLLHKQVPAGDGGLALGQAVVAAQAIQALERV